MSGVEEESRAVGVVVGGYSTSGMDREGRVGWDCSSGSLTSDTSLKVGSMFKREPGDPGTRLRDETQGDGDLRGTESG